MTTDSFPPFEPAQRTGTPEVALNPPGFHVAELYEISFRQQLRVLPRATERWIQLATEVIAAETNHFASLEVTNAGAFVVGTFKEKLLEEVVERIDTALDTVSNHYYPNQYNLDKQEWERWRAVQRDVHERARKFRGPKTTYAGAAQTGSL